jgi:hypothetical protein
MSVEILTEMEIFQPIRGWRIVFKRISKIGWKEAKLKCLAHDRDPLGAVLGRVMNLDSLKLPNCKFMLSGALRRRDVS